MSYLLDYNPGTPQYTYPRRGGAKLSGTAIIHTAECAMDLEGDDSSAEVCAHFIANRADYGSYHRLVDSDSIIDMVPWEYEAWQDSETNNWAVGISAAVQAGKWHSIPSGRRDRIYRNMAACAADFVQYMAGKGVTVPLRRITGAEARRRVPGFCAHGDSGVARSDPGTQFDWALFFNYTAQALNGSLSYAGTDITPLEEEDMGNVESISDEAAVKIADVLLDRIRGGNTLGQVVAETRGKYLDVIRVVEGIPDAILDRKRGGSTIGETVNEARGQHLQIVGLIQGINTGGAVDVEALAAALSEQLEARDLASLAEKLQITVKDS